MPVLEASSFQKYIDQPVQVVGCVAHAGCVLESPFTEEQGVAIRIVAKVPSGGFGGGAEKTLFIAKCCVGFNVTDGVRTLHVDVKEQSEWLLHLKRTDVIHNIYRDDEQGCLQSGGEKGRRSQRRERPYALKFWHDFNQGKDHPSRMTQANGKGMSGFGNRPRMALEYVLKVGDPVAVKGTLRLVKGSLVLKADSASNITNVDTARKFGCQLGSPMVAAAKPEVLQMSPYQHTQQQTLLQALSTANYGNMDSAKVASRPDIDTSNPRQQ